MATCIPIPNHVIIWLDQHIGLLKSNTELKTGISEQVDPENRLPASPIEPDTNKLIQFQNDMAHGFENIPQNLKAFSQKEECLQCMDESLKANKKIFFITSGSMGTEIAPDIFQKYSSLKTMYVFCGYYNAHLELAEDCLEHDISCIMYDFHTDLLVRLLRDVAEYFISEGDGELELDEKLAYSAILYFTWAKLLLERANQFDLKKIFVRLKYVEERIAYTEELIKKLNNDEENSMSNESYK